MSRSNKNSKHKIVKKSAGILRNKWYLYLTEFFAGMSVMAVELGASRLLYIFDSTRSKIN